MAVYDVTKYGAKGDGVTDDTAAITSAIKVINGPSLLVFPPGHYIVSGSLELDISDISVIGAGMGVTVIDTSATDDLSHIGIYAATFAFGTTLGTTRTNTRLANLTVKCSNGKGVPDHQKGIYIGRVANAIVENVQVIGSKWEAIYHDGTPGKNISVRRCDISDHGLSAIDCNNALVQGFEARENYIHDGAAGIHIIGHNVRVVDNNLTNLVGFAAIITNVEQFAGQYVHNLIIQGNQISNIGKGASVGRYGIVIGLGIDDNNVIVSHNIITNMNDTAGQPCQGIRVDGGTGVIISHNIIADCIGGGHEGIGITAIGALLDNNIIRGAGWNYGMICENSVLKNNRVEAGAVTEGVAAYRDDLGSSTLIDCTFNGKIIYGGVTSNADGAIDGKFISKISRSELSISARQ